MKSEDQAGANWNLFHNLSPHYTINSSMTTSNNAVLHASVTTKIDTHKIRFH